MHKLRLDELRFVDSGCIESDKRTGLPLALASTV